MPDQTTPDSASASKRRVRRPGLTAAGAMPDAVTHFSALPDDALVGFPAVEALLSASTSTVWRRIKDNPDFPKPLRDGRCTRFRVGDIRRYLAKKAA